MKYFLSLIILLALSCKSQKKRNMEVEGKLQLLAQDGFFPVERPEAQVIGDAKTLMAFYSKVNLTRKPSLPIPDIDFTTHKVLVACIGAVATESLPIMYLKNETEKDIIVSVRLPKEAANTLAKGYPFCVYSIVDGGKNVMIEMN